MSGVCCSAGVVRSPAVILFVVDCRSHVFPFNVVPFMFYTYVCVRIFSDWYDDDGFGLMLRFLNRFSYYVSFCLLFLCLPASSTLVPCSGFFALACLLVALLCCVTIAGRISSYVLSLLSCLLFWSSRFRMLRGRRRIAASSGSCYEDASVLLYFGSFTFIVLFMDDFVFSRLTHAGSSKRPGIKLCLAFSPLPYVTVRYVCFVPACASLHALRDGALPVKCSGTSARALACRVELVCSMCALRLFCSSSYLCL